MGPVARRFGVDRTTVKYHAIRLGLLPASPPEIVSVYGARKKHYKTLPETAQEDYRAQWLAAMSETPEPSMSVLQAHHKKLYTWLYRHDNEWLQNHRPASRRKGRINRE
jgi:hypothetical protein